jgi:hypothetical protein
VCIYAQTHPHTPNLSLPTNPYFFLSHPPPFCTQGHSTLCFHVPPHARHRRTIRPLASRADAYTDFCNSTQSLSSWGVSHTPTCRCISVFAALRATGSEGILQHGRVHVRGLPVLASPVTVLNAPQVRTSCPIREKPERGLFDFGEGGRHRLHMG